MNRAERAEKARQTLKCFEKGFYTLGTCRINYKSKFNTEFISDKQLEALTLPNGDFTPEYTVLNESVVKTVFDNPGCGVFGNDATDVADIFYRLLKNEGYEKYFERIIFAVYDRQGDQYNIFKKKFKSK